MDIQVQFAIKSKNVEYIYFYYGRYRGEKTWLLHQIDNVVNLTPFFIPIKNGLHIDVKLKDESKPYDLILKVVSYTVDYNQEIVERILAETNTKLTFTESCPQLYVP